MDTSRIRFSRGLGGGGGGIFFGNKRRKEKKANDKEHKKRTRNKICKRNARKNTRRKNKKIKEKSCEAKFSIQLRPSFRSYSPTLIKGVFAEGQIMDGFGGKGYSDDQKPNRV